MPKRPSHLAFALFAGALAGAGCENAVGSSAPAPPTASLACPDHADVGVEFVIDGSASTADGDTFKDIALTVIENLGGGVHEPLTELRHALTLDHDAVITAVLDLKSDTGMPASARCRFTVGDPFVVDPPPPPPDPTDPTEPSDPSEPREPGVPVDLTGTWAFFAYDAIHVSTFGLSPGEQCAPAPTVAFVTLTQDGTHVSMTAKTCSISLPAVDTWIGPQISRFTPAAVAALPALASEFELAHGEVGDVFRPISAPRDLVAGANLPAGAGLPTSSGATGVFDADGDTFPGVALDTYDDAGALVDNHEVIYRRTVRAFSGVVVSSDVIEGAAPGSWEVDGETALLDDVAGFLVPDHVGDASRFKMVRTNATSCADLPASTLPQVESPDLGGCFVYGQ
jgi:hypothetical protein